jgi:hypothetical protein
MRFTDFLRTSVLLFAGSASALALCAVVGIYAADEPRLLLLASGWWLLAALAGLWLGRRADATKGIARLLASARAASALPEVEPGAILLNRLWPLAAYTVVAGTVAFLFPQVPAIAAGYSLAIALAWRRQANAVQAVEERDGVQFHVERSELLGPTKLVRTAGLKRYDA